MQPHGRSCAAELQAANMYLRKRDEREGVSREVVCGVRVMWPETTYVTCPNRLEVGCVFGGSVPCRNEQQAASRDKLREHTVERHECAWTLEDVNRADPQLPGARALGCFLPTPDSPRKFSSMHAGSGSAVRGAGRQRHDVNNKSEAFAARAPPRYEKKPALRKRGLNTRDGARPSHRDQYETHSQQRTN